MIGHVETVGCIFRTKQDRHQTTRSDFASGGQFSQSPEWANQHATLALIPVGRPASNPPNSKAIRTSLVPWADVLKPPTCYSPFVTGSLIPGFALALPIRRNEQVPESLTARYTTSRGSGTFMAEPPSLGDTLEPGRNRQVECLNRSRYVNSSIIFLTSATREGGERTLLPLDTGRWSCWPDFRKAWKRVARYPTPMDGPVNLTEAGEHLGLAPSTVRSRILAGELDAEKDGGRWVIYPEALSQYREGRKFVVDKIAHPSEGDQKVDAPPLTEAEKAVLEEAGINWR